MKVFCTGVVSRDTDGFSWIKEVQAEYPNHDFVDAYDVPTAKNVYEEPNKTVEELEEELLTCDAVLARWDDSSFLAGTMADIMNAYHDDIPVFLWYDGSRDLLHPSYYARATFDDRDKCVKVLLALGGDTSGFTLS